MISPSNKKTFIASMNKYNPYRIPNISESIYNKILQSRELSSESCPGSPCSPKAIYLPPVKPDQGSTNLLIPNSMTFEYSDEPLSQKTQKDFKTSKFQILSKSVDISQPKQKSEFLSNIKKNLNSSIKVPFNSRRRNSTGFKQTIRTMTAMQNHEKNLNPAPRYKEMKSPWAFQTFKYYQIKIKY
jgi:hypothetical protein